MTDESAGPDLPSNGKPVLDLTGAEWISADPEGIIQIAFVEGYIVMRDGRNPDGPTLTYTPNEWRAFVLGARDGEFDLDPQSSTPAWATPAPQD
ncbi:DUF397 domain-containing protein [Kitasatospora viridis]|uniref:Uncharacterized protein DUF397 n=1 Tax=Kitasatospora viridis TaxID=281105 RepID=A0A561SAC7_9ACTN|nr:DUF397 domain-containing protein [Kitasatospora viridis]TWF71755.1 uncharacterized protein DUF397 [Kitasatospora viridis]